MLTPIPPRSTLAPIKSPIPTPRANTVAPVSKPIVSPARTPVKTPSPPPAKATVSKIAPTPCPTVTRAAQKQSNPTQGGLPSNGTGVGASTSGKSTEVAGGGAVVGRGPQGVGVSGGPGLIKGSTTVSTGKKESNPVSNIAIKDNKSDKAQPPPKSTIAKTPCPSPTATTVSGKASSPKSHRSRFLRQ
ncbi:hypothetical protein PR002_g17556 [Phytophthora rubi]|nr:hypothetical protein PR002_g17556 [Phytophthora rubi]